MVSDFDRYMQDVFSQLDENTSDEYKKEHVTYTFSTKLVNNNLDYFEWCMGKQLSAYKALLFFSDYLHNEEWQNEINNR
jgi:hypothetical protein